MSIYQKKTCADVRAAYNRDMNNAAATKTMNINEVFRTLVGTRSECLGQLEDLFAAGKVDTKTFREAEAFYTGEPSELA